MNNNKDNLKFFVAGSFYLQYADKLPILRKDIKYLTTCDMKWKETTIVKFNNDNIIGCAGLFVNPDNLDEVWMTFLSVHSQHRNKGVAKELAAATVNWAKENNKKLLVSSFTEDGRKWLYPIYKKLEHICVIKYSDEERMKVWDQLSKRAN